jgi:hypothetical protein
VFREKLLRRQAREFHSCSEIVRPNRTPTSRIIIFN